MFAFANVTHFFPDKLAGLGSGGFSLLLIAPGTFERLFFRHNPEVVSYLQVRP